MKKRNATLFLLMLYIFLIALSVRVLAEERNIYVGDLIELRVSSQNISEDELREKFKDFEIVDIKEEPGSFIITLRSFEVGEKTVQLGDKKIIITVKSTLDEIKRDDVFEGDLSPEKPRVSIAWQYVFYIFLFTFLSTGGIYLWRYLKKGKKPSLNPYAHFMNKMKTISLDDRDFLVRITRYFKEYLEFSYSCRIRGKTSVEIVNEINCLPDLQERIPAIRSWLEECDYYKFGGVVAWMEMKQRLAGKLVEMVREIEKAKEVKL